MITNNYVFNRWKNVHHELSRNGLTNYNAYKQVSKLPSVSFKRIYRKKINIFVDGLNLYYKLNNDLRDKSHISLRVRDLFRLKSIPRSFDFSVRKYQMIINAFDSGDASYLHNIYIYYLKIIKELSPKLILLNSTIDPISRILAKISKDLGIISACVQHGVYGEKSVRYDLDEGIVDYYFALDLNQVSILSKDIFPSKIISLSNFTKVKFNNFSPKNVLFVGTDIERYGRENYKIYLLNVYQELINNFIENYRCKISYKYHPSEKRIKHFKKDVKYIKSWNKNNSIIDFDFVIGFGSTLLRESASKNIFTVQIYNEKISAINYQNLGYCFTINDDINIFNNLTFLFENGTMPCVYTKNISNMLKKIISDDYSNE